MDQKSGSFLVFYPGNSVAAKQRDWKQQDEKKNVSSNRNDTDLLFQSVPLRKKLNAATVVIESSHYIVYHGADKNNHHAEHYRGTEPRKQVDEKHDTAQKFTKGEEERNGGDKN